MPFSASALLVAAVSALAFTRGPITFNRDVQPILMKNCQGCHSPGRLAPMSLGTYEETLPWAMQIRAVVVNEKMPPKIAESHIGLFDDSGRLSPAEIATIVRWVDDGSLEGKTVRPKARGNRR
jgi:hypothetical protein